MIKTTVLVKKPFIIQGQLYSKNHVAFFNIRSCPTGDSPSGYGFHLMPLRLTIFRNHPLPCCFLRLTSQVMGTCVVYKAYMSKSY